jgi:hypothetical protein
MSQKDYSITSLLPGIANAIKVTENTPTPAPAPESKPPKPQDTDTTEMLAWVMTAADGTAEVTFTYNTDGFLESLHISESLSEKSYIWLLANTPYTAYAFKEFKASCQKATFVRKKLEVTFQMFWDRHNDKERSSKKKTEALWNKLSQANQIKAYLYIPAYNRRRGAADKKYATTYLSDELWNN